MVAVFMLLGVLAQPALAAAQGSPAVSGVGSTPTTLAPRLVASTSAAAESVPILPPDMSMLEVGITRIDDGAAQAIVPIIINPGPTPVAAFQLELVFDTDALTPIGCDHISGFGVCAPQEDGSLVLNAARIESWTTRTNVVEITFDVSGSAAVRVGEVVGVWGDETSNMRKIPYDVVFGAVHVGDENTTTADQQPGATLVGDGAITGTATDGAHSAGYGAGVCVVHEESHAARCAVTNSRGEYRIDGLPAGSYTVEFIGPDDDQPSHSHDGVIVEADTTTQGVDFDLRQPSSPIVATSQLVESHDALAATPQGVVSSNVSADGELTGSISDAAGEPVAAVLVCAREIGIGTEVCAASGFDGTYSIAGLLAGNYIVSVSDPGQRFGDQTSSTFGYNADAPKLINFDLTSR